MHLKQKRDVLTNIRHKFAVRDTKPIWLTILPSDIYHIMEWLPDGIIAWLSHGNGKLYCKWQQRECKNASEDEKNAIFFQTTVFSIQNQFVYREKLQIFFVLFRCGTKIKTWFFKPLFIMSSWTCPRISMKSATATSRLVRIIAQSYF